MDLKFKKTKQAEKSKLKNEIKFNISNNSIIKNKLITQVFKLNSLSEVSDLLCSISQDVKLKILINYSTDDYFVFKTETFSKKEYKSKKNHQFENSKLADNQLDSKEIAKLFKSFYSEEEFKFYDSLENKQLNSKLKLEIAPKEFTISNDYLITDNRYARIISLEHINNSCILKNVTNNINTWVSIDCYRFNNEFILEKLNQMEADKSIEKIFNDFMIAKMSDIIEKLKEETIFQCEIKLLLYNNNLEQLKNDSELIIDKLNENYCTSYIAQEKINTRKLFEKAIYPNDTMDIIHSIISKDLFKMIGSEKYV